MTMASPTDLLSPNAPMFQAKNPPPVSAPPVDTWGVPQQPGAADNLSGSGAAAPPAGGPARDPISPIPRFPRFPIFFFAAVPRVLVDFLDYFI